MKKWGGALIALLVVVWSGVIAVERITGTSIFVRFGGLWLPVDDTTPFLSQGVRAALTVPIPEVAPGHFEWRELGDGFEITEIPVLAGDLEVDRLLLARLDPHDFRFAVHNQPNGNYSLNEWRRETGAVVVVNGSYYGRKGEPTTPVMMGGDPFGPSEYQAEHGAFVDDGADARVEDLTERDWAVAFDGVEHGLVSFPMLIRPDGAPRAEMTSNWLANRSFIAQDSRGRVIIGTSADAFFSLNRLATFLQGAPLDLELALNLDGGPVACQSVDYGDVKRRTCGVWEIQVDDEGEAKMLPPLAVMGDPPLPIVIAVYPR